MRHRRVSCCPATTIRVPAEPYFRERVPWRSGLVKLDCGPVMVAHLHGECREGQAVRLSFQLDKSGQAVAFARPAQEMPEMAEDRQWREMVADPKFRRVLVTDGRGAIGREIAKALLAAGAASVHAGIAQPWKPWPEAALRAAGITPVALDVGDEKSVAELAAELGAKVDILVNTTEHVRPGGLIDHPGANDLRDAIEQNCLGFAHLARGFGPIMRARGADGSNSAAAWVNIFSVYALANWPAFGAASAAQAACLSLSHCLRAELRAGGVRVVNLFTGPTDTEWFQTVPPPKVAPRTIAAALVAALRAGTEDVFVGEVAEDLRRRLEANSKAVERELGA